MRRIQWVILLAFVLGAGLPALAQEEGPEEHFQFGLFPSYFRESVTDRDFLGLGMNVAGTIKDIHQIEAEMSYDFERIFSEHFTDPLTGDLDFERSPLRVIHGLFGYKIHTRTAPARVFGTLKAGFINFRFENTPATLGTFFSSVGDLRDENMRFALYPGAGFEAFAGPFGIRVEAGDEIYWIGKPHHNFRMTLGPTFHF